MMNHLSSMSAFVKAADLGSFTTAGRALGVSSQMVGKLVSQLEERFDAQLLNRPTRRQSLTAIGQMFYERCRVVLAEVEAAETIAHELGTTPRGRLRISAPMIFGSIALAPLLWRFQRDHPQAEIALDLTDRYVDVVGKGYDAVLRRGPLKDSELIAHALVPYRLIACASPAYLAERGMPRTPADLTAHDCLDFVFASGQSWTEWRFTKGEEVHEVPLRCRFQVNDARVLREAALQGHGIAVQSNLIFAEDLAAGRLVQVLDDYETPRRPLHILFASGGPPTQTLRRYALGQSRLGRLAPKDPLRVEYGPSFNPPRLLYSNTRSRTPQRRPVRTVKAGMTRFRQPAVSDGRLLASPCRMRQRGRQTAAG